MTEKKVSVDPYKGVRDFYPEEMFVHNYILETMRKSAESFGYLEYSASLLEPSELFETKSGEEIVSEQMYTFEDRGGRRVALRPEMTPTLARMVAKRRRDYPLPIRWFTIANVFRYERPQRGRLREHWQLNADIFGVGGIEADIEIISLTHQIMKNFDAEDKDFEIRVSDRHIFDGIFAELNFNQNARRTALRLLDRREKIDNFESEFERNLGAEQAQHILERLPKLEPNERLRQLAEVFSKRGIKNITIDTSIVRGFDYYTGMVFEVFDTSPENNRSLFGGGRYDNLLEMFREENIPAVGFGMGDVTIRDFLTTHNLLPAYASSTDLYICTTSPDFIEDAEKLANALRSEGVAVAVNVTDKKVGDQISYADKRAILFILCVGKEEVKSGVFAVKCLADGREKKMNASMIGSWIKTR